MYNHTLYGGRKHICRYSFQAFSTAEVLKSYVNDCLRINGKQMIKLSKTGEYVRFKKCENKIKSPFMMYGYFDSNLVPEDDEKKNLYQSYSNK